MTVLKQGDSGTAVRTLQNLLKAAGAPVVPDGKYGPNTRNAVMLMQVRAALPATGEADQALIDWLTDNTGGEPMTMPATDQGPSASVSRSPSTPSSREPVALAPDPALRSTGGTDLDDRVLQFILREEVSSRQAYEARHAVPHFPGGASGITIGIGYDLQFNTSNFRSDWGEHLPSATLDALSPFLGRRGSAEEARALSGHTIPFEAAWHVFQHVTMPEYIRMTESAFPGSKALPALCHGALVSLVYNRGGGMRGDRRREMRAIRDCIQEGRLRDVSAEFRSMARLWPTLKGLRLRRDREAQLWEEGLAEA